MRTRVVLGDVHEAWRMLQDWERRGWIDVLHLGEDGVAEIEVTPLGRSVERMRMVGAVA